MATTKAAVTPLTSLRVSTHQIPAHNLIPNTSIQHKPVLIYHSCFQNASASAIEAHLTRITVVAPQWRYTMYSQTHYHSTTHEVLCIVHGKAKLCFGGEDNPGRVEPVVQKGDVVVVPAGVGHRLMKDLDGGFQMVGSYPSDAKVWDMCYGKEGEEEKVDGIRGLGWFERDPVFGDEGPVLRV
ncbi:cupin domain-containing protein [Pseudovirgaria hyperparasitica]|uniref:Cupin domain-containing protein n=1 Tax=Pseudovirgaria hyperparasitica TaxID=470096 RepID=A0A6A6WJ89_9PEZI|nr:cupin domain-containing protein [Pseudovirgaria hyperparasitica]KAF2762210.1 cupin domain-containing protein [Pseudovirgaria hyperparasitica]